MKDDITKNTDTMKYLVSQVKEKNNIIDIVEEMGVELQKMGSVYKGRCPFHNDTNPSFTVYPETNSWYCFGCQKSGDIFSFIMEKKNITFRVALEELASRVNVHLGKNMEEYAKMFEKKTTKLKIMEWAIKYYQLKRLDYDPVTEYLVNTRGLDENKIREWRIGYCPMTDNKGIFNYLEKRGFTAEQIKESGFVTTDGSDYFKGNIIFPYIKTGTVVYLTGRGFPDKTFRKPLADKIILHNLFFEDNLHHTTALIAEGEIDTYTLNQAGFNACGIPGVTSFKKEWINKFKHLDKVFICLDGDDAGMKATQKIGSLLKRNARVVVFPVEQMPNGFIIKDWNDLYIHKFNKNLNDFKKEVERLLEKSEPFLDHYIASMLDTINKNEMTVVVEKQIIPELLDCDELELDYYIKMIIQKSGDSIKYRAIKKEIEKARLIQRDSEINDIEFIGFDDKIISPAMDFVGDTAYVSVSLPMTINSKKQGIPHLIVTSRKEMLISSNRKEMEKRNIVLKSPFIYPYTRWSREDIINYTKSKDQSSLNEVFNSTKAMYTKYIDFGEPHIDDLMALWTMGTYVHRLFNSFPYILLTGEMSSGKTKTLSVADQLCFNSMYLSNLTPATLYRIIQGSSSTLLIDEAEQLKEQHNVDLITLLNNGYKKVSKVPRCNPNTLEVEYFEVYSPKIIANIKDVPSPLSSRCIRVVMLRTLNRNKANSVVSDMKEDWGHLRSALYQFGLTYFAEIEKEYFQLILEEKSVALSGRETEKWYPLLAIVKFLEKHGIIDLYQPILKIAKKLGKESIDTGLDDWSNALIHAAYRLVFKEGTITPIEIKQIRGIMPAKFRNLLSDHWIGRKIRTLGLSTEIKRVRSGYRYTITKDSIKNTMKRFGILGAYFPKK